MLYSPFEVTLLTVSCSAACSLIWWAMVLRAFQGLSFQSGADNSRRKRRRRRRRRRRWRNSPLHWL